GDFRDFGLVHNHPSKTKSKLASHLDELGLQEIVVLELQVSLPKVSEKSVRLRAIVQTHNHLLSIMLDLEIFLLISLDRRDNFCLGSRFCRSLVRAEMALDFRLGRITREFGNALKNSVDSLRVDFLLDKFLTESVQEPLS